MEDEVVGAAVLQQGPVVVPCLVGWENSENVVLSLVHMLLLDSMVLWKRH